MATKPAHPAGASGLFRPWHSLRSQAAIPYWFLLPTIIPVLALTLYPLIRGIWLAFTSYDLYNKDASFVGWQNFLTLFTEDKLFWLALHNTVFWTVCVVTLSYVVGMLTALALNEPIRWRACFEALRWCRGFAQDWWPA